MPISTSTTLKLALELAAKVTGREYNAALAGKEQELEGGACLSIWTGQLMPDAPSLINRGPDQRGLCIGDD